METSDIIKKVRKIEIKTRGLSTHLFAGEYHSAFKGRGMSFSEVREYQYGDDIRNIDWNVTARFDKPYIKVFEEERELTVIILVDVSGSLDFGSEETTKRDFVTEIAACLSFSAISNNDKIGVILFSDRIEKFIPPKKGRQHILRIIRELLTFEPEGKGTDAAMALQYLTSVIKKRSTVFMISDFVCKDFSDALRIAGHKHDLLALNVYDKREVEDFPNVGLVYMQDAESGKKMLVDTSNSTVRENLKQAAKKRRENLANTFLRAGVQDVAIANGDDYVKPLIKLFKSR
ncbi:MAG: DUF58 domain-containing protein [Bacteroidales bacterium]|nr:DUF58 domain-containing protein [Bacteroidales bacterium]